MKLSLALLFISILLAGIACAPSPTQSQGDGEGAGKDAAKSATPVAGGGETAAQTGKQDSTETATPIVVRPETIAEAAKNSLSGVPIVKRDGIGAQATERATIQAAIDAMMTANIMASVAANDTADYIRAEGVAATVTDFGRGHYIVDYVRDAFTAYCYIWSANGTIQD